MFEKLTIWLPCEEAGIVTDERKARIHRVIQKKGEIDCCAVKTLTTLQFCIVASPTRSFEEICLYSANN